MQKSPFQLEDPLFQMVGVGPLFDQWPAAGCVEARRGKSSAGLKQGIESLKEDKVEGAVINLGAERPVRFCSNVAAI